MNKNKFKVDFIGVGAQKSATSWIFKCLSEHPDICMPLMKEIHFFSDDVKFNKGMDFYKNYFKSCKKNKIIGEYSTLYLSNESALLRIKDNFPDVKIIISLRNPIERAFSHFLHIKSKNNSQKNLSLNNALKKFPEIIENGMYEKHVKLILDTFSKNNILILFFDDINKYPRQQIKNIYNFLGVRSNFIPTGINIKYNTSSARLSSAHKTINKLYFLFKKKFIGRLIIKILKSIRINSYLFYNILSKHNKKPILSNEDREYLVRIYKDDIYNLGILLNKDLSNWI
jgi:hypothetical protein